MVPNQRLGKMAIHQDWILRKWPVCCRSLIVMRIGQSIAHPDPLRTARFRVCGLHLTLTLMAVMLMGCARPPDSIGIENAAIPVMSVPDLAQHRIIIASTRQASEVTGAFYSGGRAPNLSLASVDVTVPPTHVTGQLERPRHLPPDPRVEFSIIHPVLYRSEASFMAEINRELATRPPGHRKVLLFIHGYNTTTSDALLRLTQFIHDTGYEGVPVLFTWASAAKAPRYVYDLNSALVARVKLKDMSDILGATDAEGIDIFAHSMGTFLAMEGLVDAAQAHRLGDRKRIDHIVLAAPDIDIDLFRTQIALLPRPILEKMYILISKDDSALRLSRRIAGGVPRVGAADAKALESLGPTVVDLSDITDSGSGNHTKFAGSPEVVRLIGAGLNTVGRFGDVPGLDQFLTGLPIRIFGE
jgi:esterase/lipase superfamily enzyme